MLCVILSKHNVEPHIFAHVKSDNCGERTLGSLSGDGVVTVAQLTPYGRWLDFQKARDMQH